VLVYVDAAGASGEARVLTDDDWVVVSPLVYVRSGMDIEVTPARGAVGDQTIDQVAEEKASP
jgi:hypothetical protein